MSDDNETNLPATTKPDAKRRIDLKDIEAIAALVAMKISESGACRKIGLNPATWHKFKAKNRNSEKFGAVLERFRADKLAVHLSNIESASQGKHGHRADWRASAWMAEKALTSDGRYSDRVIVQPDDGFITVAPPGMAPVQMRRTEWHGIMNKALKKGYNKQKTLDVPATARLLSGGEVKP